MRCWKCGKELQDGVTTCSHCRASQNRTQPESAAGKALREIYDRFGSEAVFTNEIYFTNVLADLLQDSKKLRNLLKWSLDAGMGKLYLQQLEKQGSADEDFHKRVKRILVEDACIADAMSEEIMQYMDEMIGWPVKDMNKAGAQQQERPKQNTSTGSSQTTNSSAGAAQTEKTSASIASKTTGYDPFKRQTKPFGAESSSAPKKQTTQSKTATKVVRTYEAYRALLENTIAQNGYQELTSSQITTFISTYNLNHDWGIEYQDVRMDMINMIAAHRKASGKTSAKSSNASSSGAASVPYPQPVQSGQAGVSRNDSALSWSHFPAKTADSFTYKSEQSGNLFAIVFFLVIAGFFASVGGIWISVILMLFVITGTGMFFGTKNRKGKLKAARISRGLRIDWAEIPQDHWAIGIDGKWIVSGKDKTLTNIVLDIPNPGRIVLVKITNEEKMKAEFVAETTEIL